MSAINDLIRQITDTDLREKIQKTPFSHVKIAHFSKSGFYRRPNTLSIILYIDQHERIHSKNQDRRTRLSQILKLDCPAWHRCIQHRSCHYQQHPSR